MLYKKYGIPQMRLAPILPYITWGYVWDPQNKRGISNKNTNSIYNKRRILPKKIFNIVYAKTYIIYPKKEGGKECKIKDNKGWPIETAQK